MKRNIIAFRPDKETQEILSEVGKKRSISDYLREAVKFYYYHAKKKDLSSLELDEAIKELRQVAVTLQQTTGGVNSSAITNKKNNNDRDEENGFDALFLNIGQQFESWASQPEGGPKLDTIDNDTVTVIADDDEIDFS